MARRGGKEIFWVSGRDGHKTTKILGPPSSSDHIPTPGLPLPSESGQGLRHATSCLFSGHTDGGAAMVGARPAARRRCIRHR